MASIRFERVVKTYPNSHTAIRGLDLSIHDGELMVVVGPSGCGKSTFLRLLAGLEPITAGTLRIGDAIANDRSPQARNIAMVFQDYALYPTMTVRENLGFPLKMRRLNRQESARRVAWAADLLDLGSVLDRLPRELSGGQRQRVAMGRALVREPSVFLLDEPLSNLDAKLRAQVRAEINDLQRRTGTTMVYVTHDQVEAMTLGQRIAVLNQGQLEQVADPQTLYDLPATPFVAGFIGSPPMNLFDASLEHLPEGGWWVTANGERIALVGADALASAHGGAIRSRGDNIFIAGIRPEHLHPAEAGASGFAFTVTASEYLGHETLIHGHPGTGDAGGKPWIVRLPGMRVLPPGKQLNLACPAARHVRLFPGTGPSV